MTVRPNARLDLLRRLRRNGGWLSWQHIVETTEEELYEAASSGEYDWISDGDSYNAEVKERLEWLAVARREAEAIGEIEVAWPGPKLRITDKGIATLDAAERTNGCER